jgi:hypothetical protein
MNLTKSLAPLAVLALTLIAGCTADVADSEPSAGEPVGEASQPLFKDDIAGAYPWGASAGWTSNTDVFLFHEIDSVSGKFFDIEGVVSFPEFTGLWSSTKAEDCALSTATLTLFKRVSSSDTWTQFDTTTVNAVPTYGVDSLGRLTITECSADAAFGGCGDNGIHFVTSNQLLVKVTQGTPDGSMGNMADTVRRSDGDFCSP